MAEHSFTIHSVVFLIIRKKNKILFLKRQNTSHRDGQFGLPAGHKEAYESLKEAVIREAQEELNIVVQNNKLRLVAIIDRLSSDRETLDFYFEVEYWQGEIQNNEPHKCSELSWLTTDNLPVDVIDYVSDSLKLMEGQDSDTRDAYFEIGWDKPYM